MPKATKPRIIAAELICRGFSGNIRAFHLKRRELKYMICVYTLLLRVEVASIGMNVYSLCFSVAEAILFVSNHLILIGAIAKR